MFSLPLQKAERNAMLHFIQIFTCDSTMQVKCAIGNAILHKLPIYYEYMCLCRIFSHVIKALIQGFDYDK